MRKTQETLNLPVIKRSVSNTSNSECFARGPPRGVTARAPCHRRGRGRGGDYTPTQRFSLLDITSGLPDDSREGKEREAERRLRDLPGRVKAARAVVARCSGCAVGGDRPGSFRRGQGAGATRSIPRATRPKDATCGDWEGPRASTRFLRTSSDGASDGSCTTNASGL